MKLKDTRLETCPQLKRTKAANSVRNLSFEI